MSQLPKRDNLYIRKMTLADLPQVEALEKASFTAPWPGGSFEYELQPDSFSICLVAIDGARKEGEDLCGAIVAWRIVDSLEIGTISVAGDYRHKGLGRDLLAHAMLLSQEQGVIEAILEVRASNQDALRLYYGLGFETVGIRPGYYEDNNEDALLLTLKPINFDQLRNLISYKYVL